MTMHAPMARRTKTLLAMALTALGVLSGTTARAQQASDSLEAINADYLRELDQIEKQRLGRIEKLATASPQQATELYVAYFQAALSGGHYREAEPVAERLLKAGKLDPRVLYLAEVTNILSELDRGAYDESVESLTAAVQASRNEGAGNQPVALVLPRHTRLSLIETYYQKLVQAGRFDLARKALGLIAERSQDPALRGFATSHLARLALVGQAAPAIEGTDQDGKPFRLADLKGDAVLVVFWATWCLPCGPEADMLDQIHASYKEQGLRIVGVNVDNLQADAGTTETVSADVRRFLIEHNIPFTNLINGAGDKDYAKDYGVSQIPANVLIDREGKVSQLDLTAANIDAAIRKTLGK